MKHLTKISAAMLIMLMMLSMSAIAQRGQGKGMHDGQKCTQRGMMNWIPDLTDEQQEKIKTFRTAHLKETLPIRNKQEELYAKLKTLTTAEKTDKKAIEEVIDQIADNKATLMKKRNDFIQKVRAILSDDQRIAFDQRISMRGGKGMGKGHTRGGHGMKDGRGMKGHHPNCPRH